MRFHLFSWVWRGLFVLMAWVFRVDGDGNIYQKLINPTNILFKFKFIRVFQYRFVFRLPSHYFVVVVATK